MGSRRRISGTLPIPPLLNLRRRSDSKALRVLRWFAHRYVQVIVATLDVFTHALDLPAGINTRRHINVLVFNVERIIFVIRVARLGQLIPARVLLLLKGIINFIF